jgi:signal transduction histidine kinase
LITSRLFRTHFAIVAVAVLSCVFVGSWILNFVVQSIETLHEKEHQRSRQPPMIYANFIEQMGPNDAVNGLARMLKLQGPQDPIKFSLMDEKGKLLFPPDGDAPPMAELPQKLHAPQDVEPNPQPASHGFSLMPAPPPNQAPYNVLRLNYNPPRYLVMKFRPRNPGGHGPQFFPLSVLVMIIMVLAGIAVALLITIFRSLREHVLAADSVISELQRGNLKARFPIERMDEIGNAKTRFNAMADEIERLVERLRSAEASRNNLLQELAHDLRTPVASLGSILETVFTEAQMSPDVAELAQLAEKEVDYMGHLVEDLLLLAQLSEPSYTPNRQHVDFMALLEEECDSIALRKDDIQIVKKFELEEVLLSGDEHLFRRLIRNSLENACSYAKAKVEVHAFLDASGRLGISFRDDGPGFDADALQKFGERRGQRMIKKTQGGRLSLGLGSVIMKSVISLHRGDLRATNNVGGGATVSFTIPLTNAAT